MRTLSIIAAVMLSTNAVAQDLGFRAFVEDITTSLPSHIDVPSDAMGRQQEAMPSDVLDYARFFWVLERTEGNCRDIGMRMAVSMVNPGISSWPTMAMFDGHPDQGAYLETITVIDAAYEEMGEVEFCGAMHRLLGPDGDLMSAAADIDGLIVEAGYQVGSDGVLWSSRDYCERRWFLDTPPVDQAMHDLMCEWAETQGF